MSPVSSPVDSSSLLQHLLAHFLQAAGGLELVFASKLMSNPTLLSNSAKTMPSVVKQLLKVNFLFLVTVNKGMAAPTGKLSSQT